MISLSNFHDYFNLETKRHNEIAINDNHSKYLASHSYFISCYLPK